MFKKRLVNTIFFINGFCFMYYFFPFSVIARIYISEYLCIPSIKQKNVD
jgi:hypothetical protein